jgi:hypothetical protein
MMPGLFQNLGVKNLTVGNILYSQPSNHFNGIKCGGILRVIRMTTRVDFIYCC